MNIGIFSGSFNPIHIGHVILANYIVEFTEIDEVWFIVSPHNPLKSQNELSDEHTRLEMVNIALKDYTKLKASDFEFSLPRPSYTIDTLKALNKAYPQHDFTLIIGADNWNIFENWKESNTILDNYKLKVYPRLGSRISIANKLKNRVEALDSPIVEISSTFIRESFSGDKDIRAFLPAGVYDYIIENKLYRQK